MRHPEQLTNDPAPAEPAKPKGGDLARLAGIWCGATVFQRWTGTTSEDTAKAYLCQLCGITSRAQLDCNPTAAAIFNEAIRKPYRDHLLTQARKAA